MRNADLLWTNTCNCTFGVIHEVFLIANLLVGERGVYMTTISKQFLSINSAQISEVTSVLIGS